MKRKMAAALGVLILGISLLSGCGGSAQTGGQNGAVTQTDGGSTEQENGAQAEERERVIVAMGTTSEPAAGFDPCVNWGCGEHCHEPLIQSTLLRTTADMEFENDLATDYQVSEDGLTWTFTIREDVKFSDGEPLTAADVAFTFDTALASANSEADAGFDPCVNWGCGEHCHEPLIQSTLLRTTADMEFENDLATDYQVSEDGLTWTFTIREDVKFSDGEPLTASDVAFTFNTALASANSEADLSMLERVEAPDDKTVVFHLTKPYNAFLYTLAVFGIVPEHCYEAGAYGENPIGSGRYLLKQWDRGQQVILEANPDYYGKAPNIKTVIILFMEEDAALAAVKAGEVDIAYTSATYSEEQVEGYELLACKSVDSRGISLPTLPSGNDVTVEGDMVYEGGNDVTCDLAIRQAMSYGLDREAMIDNVLKTLPSGNDVTVEGDMVYEGGNDVTCDLAIRQAMSYGLDREAMIDNVLNGYGQVAYSVSDNMPWSSDDMKAPYDEQKAKQLLADGGWKDSDGDGILEKNGTAASFTVYYPSTDSVRQALTAEFSNQMRELGIEVLYEGLGSWDELYLKMYSDPIIWGWGSNSPVENYQLYHTNGACNYTGYSNEETDRLFDEALAATDMDESYALWQQAQAAVGPNGEALWVWFANIDHLYFVRDGLKVAEQKLHPHGHGWSIVNNVDEWSWQ